MLDRVHEILKYVDTFILWSWLSGMGAWSFRKYDAHIIEKHRSWVFLHEDLMAF